jgi:hypothetical protein
VIVVSDSTALIGLAAIGGLDWLRQIYTDVIIPQAVYREVVIDGAGKAGSQDVASAAWIQMQTIQNLNDKAFLMSVIGLDEGESEAIVLAQEIGADLLLLDDAAARKYARQQKLKITGMVGVILAAKQSGIIPLVRPQLDALIAVGIFIDAKLYQQACQSVGE